jgi:hypothetical protein
VRGPSVGSSISFSTNNSLTKEDTALLLFALESDSEGQLNKDAYHCTDATVLSYIQQGQLTIVDIGVFPLRVDDLGTNSQLQSAETLGSWG